VGTVAIARWRAAMRWRRLVDEKLAPVGLSLTQWLVLESSLALSEESGDAVSQSQIARRVEFDKMTVSKLMIALERRGFVSRGPDLAGPAYRIIVTSTGRRAVFAGRRQIEAASRSKRWAPMR
jgi:DNA-binding MarR family transcriptional regulator